MKVLLMKPDDESLNAPYLFRAFESEASVIKFLSEHFDSVRIDKITEKPVFNQRKGSGIIAELEKAKTYWKVHLSDEAHFGACKIVHATITEVEVE